MAEYKSREFCRSIDCGMQRLIDNDKENELGKSFAKSFCRKECEAYKFHKWLQENNYKILKSRILEEHQEMDSEFEKISEMIEYTPENAPREVLNELLDDIKDIADNNYGKWRNVNE